MTDKIPEKVFFFPSSRRGRLARDKASHTPASLPATTLRKKIPVLGKNRVDPNLILDYYRWVEGVKRPALATLDPSKFTLSNTPQGLGDCVVLSPLPEYGQRHGVPTSIFSPSTFFRPLTQFIPAFKDNTRPFWVMAAELNGTYDLGNGHFIQRLLRAFGIPPMDIPKGSIHVPNAQVVPGRCVMHFEAGGHANWQKVALHPRARQLYPESKQILEQFIARHKEMDFWELGWNPMGIEGSREFGRRNLEDMIEFMATAEFFIGIISGPMHVATALGLKVINIINFPEPQKIYLPTLKNIAQVESEWFAPQNVLLHQEGEGPLVPRYSLNNLERALNGEIYPYWTTDYVHLIHEKL
jgi:hypothetical protein